MNEEMHDSADAHENDAHEAGRRGKHTKTSDGIKYLILVAFIAAGSYMVYKDTTITTPATQKAMETMVAACEEPEEQTSEMVQEMAGCAPVNTEEKDNDVTIETYEFKRAIPFMVSAKAYAMYKKGRLVKVVQNREITEEDMNYVKYFNE